MKEIERIQLENQLTEKFKIKFSDLKSHVDLINGTDEMNISFFWDRISREQWNGAKSFRIKIKDYESKLENEIIPFFN